MTSIAFKWFGKILNTISQQNCLQSCQFIFCFAVLWLVLFNTQWCNRQAYWIYLFYQRNIVLFIIKMKNFIIVESRSIGKCLWICYVSFDKWQQIDVVICSFFSFFLPSDPTLDTFVSHPLIHGIVLTSTKQVVNGWLCQKNQRIAIRLRQLPWSTMWAWKFNVFATRSIHCGRYQTCKW